MNDRIVMRELPADAAVPEGLDCANEEIRIAGSVQEHGFLLVLESDGEQVVAASQNAEEFLAVPLKLILGAQLDTLLEREALSVIRSLNSETAGTINYLGSFRVKGEFCSVVTHCTERLRILEFERLDRLVFPEVMNSVLTNFVGTLSKIESTLELCRAITKQVAELTGFNRVLLYSFDEVGHGTVLAEENDGSLPSYLGLRFPASDIPAQARELYVQNTVRIIPNAMYTPSPLMGLGAFAAKRIDLSFSVLRSVSPVHLEYMRNMGTISSMSLSILYEGKLWGLISGHHATPRTVPYLIRGACDMLTKMMGTQLSGHRNAEKLRKMVHFHAVQRTMLTQIAAEKSYVAGITARMDSLMQVTDASGAALLIGDKVLSSGTAPSEADLLRLAAWLDGRDSLELMHTRELGEELSWTKEITATASGLLAIRISDVRRGYILWFRPEVVQTVTWAGEPVKRQDEALHLHPRASFESWRQTVRGQSAPWTEMEIDSARDFRSALTTISLRTAEEAVELSEARFQQLTHALPALVWTSRDDGELTYVNDRWKGLGMPTQGCWFVVAGLNAEDARRVEESWRLAVADGSAFEEEVRLVQATGGERWHLVRAVPFRDVAGERAGWVGTFTDTTDRRQREAALRMTEKLATTGRMTSVIAHEINNPLESMTNLLYLLRGLSGDEGPAHDYIAMAESELQRISGITRQTLRWGRENPEKKEWFTCSAMFEDVRRLFTGKIRNREVELMVDAGDDRPFFGATGQIRQVITNLLANAIDAVPVGGKIWLLSERDEKWLEIIVRDAGSGMSAETMSQIFQPFYSTKGDLGNGLGLYISQEIVERHGGTLNMQSMLGKGTTVFVRLPSTET